ncbi:MAG: thiazole synthase [Myxococcota bacterium]|nr:thiazole synthase [Myxococcota bacterium]
MQTQSDTDTFCLGDLKLQSRVLLGTAQYPDISTMLASIEASGTQMVTLSLRRIPAHVQGREDLYGLLQEKGVHLLPNTSGCFTAKEAVLTAKLARSALETNWIKLEVIADEETLLPDGEELLIAAEKLVLDGFQVLPYTNDDPVLARKLEDIGCVAVMPLAAPIGTGLGIRNPHNLELIVSRATVPVIVDAGLGTASDVAQAFELGCEAVLLNTAVAKARRPVQMSRAVRAAAYAGRQAYLAGRMPSKTYAQASSPLEGRAWR